MRLLGEGGEQHLGRAVVALLGHAANGMANDGGDRFGVEVFLEHLQGATQPGLAHHHIQGGHHFGDKARQPQGDGSLAERPAQVFGLVVFDHLHEVTQIDLGLAFIGLRHPMHALTRHALAQALQLFDGQGHDAPGAVALVKQPFDDAQLFHVLQRIGALAKSVAPRLWKAIAALPHAQGVFGQAGVAFDAGNGHGQWLRLGAKIHAAMSLWGPWVSRTVLDNSACLGHHRPSEDKNQAQGYA